MMKKTFNEDKIYRRFIGKKAIDRFFKTFPEMREEWEETFLWMHESGTEHFIDDTFADGTRNNEWSYSLWLEEEEDYTYIALILREEVPEEEKHETKNESKAAAMDAAENEKTEGKKTMKKEKVPYEVKAIERAENVNIETMYNTYTTEALLSYILCRNHKDKMENIISMSTAVTVNPLCQKRREEAKKAYDAAIASGKKPIDYICLSCFAQAQLEYQANTDVKYRRAFEILNKEVYAIEQFPEINANIARIESFGDVASVTQALNYIHFVKRNPYTVFAAWTKNPAIWKEAFTIEEKPGNLIMIYSNPVVDAAIDEKAFFAALKVSFPFLDRMFSVFTEDFAGKNGIDINCGGRKCFTCRRCYTLNNGEVFIHELKK